MSTISGTSSASSAWSDMSASRARMKEQMFAKVDADSSGSVDATELQGMLDDFAKKSGTTATDATELLKKMDSSGDGSLSSDELDAGMKSLMPKPSSTVQFAGQRSGGGEGGGPGGPGGRPPGPPPDSTSATSSSSSTDPLDTNGDGVVSAAEQAAGDVQKLVSDLVASSDTDGDGSINSTELKTLKDTLSSAFDNALKTLQGGSSSSSSSTDASSSSSSSSSDSKVTASSSEATAKKLADLVLRQYSQYAANASEASSSALSFAA